MTRWKPIATAPCPGNFLVYIPDERPEKRIQQANNRKGFMVIGGRFAFDSPSKPTLWTELPDEPNDTNTDSA